MKQYLLENTIEKEYKIKTDLCKVVLDNDKEVGFTNTFKNTKKDKE